jgi:hypothetical protein
VLLTDTNRRNVREARKKDIPAESVNVLSDAAMDRLDLGRIGYALTVTPNDEVNSLAALHLAEVLGSMNVYQLTTSATADDDRDALPQHLRGLPLFGGKETYGSITQRFNEEGAIEAVEVKDDESNGSVEPVLPEGALPLFLIRRSGGLKVISDGFDGLLEPEQTLLALVPAQSGEEEGDDYQ